MRKIPTGLARRSDVLDVFKYEVPLQVDVESTDKTL